MKQPGSEVSMKKQVFSVLFFQLVGKMQGLPGVVPPRTVVQGKVRLSMPGWEKKWNSSWISQDSRLALSITSCKLRDSLPKILSIYVLNVYFLQIDTDG